MEEKVDKYKAKVTDLTERLNEAKEKEAHMIKLEIQLKESEE